MTRRRLDAWKEIARYLGRDVTTVRRWEKREGLPVHRHLHDKLGSVYAYADEIDAWSRCRSGQADGSQSASAVTPGGPDMSLPLVEEGASTSECAPRYRVRPWPLVAGLATVALAFVAFLSPLTPPTRASLEPPVRFALPTRPGVIVESLVISPDGRQVAFTGKADDRVGLWIQQVDSHVAGVVPGTDEATHPFWSPDNLHVGFFADGWLKRVTLATREIVPIARAPEGFGGTWNERGEILFVAHMGAPVSRVSMSGGAVTSVTQVARGFRVGHAWPEFLPDGRHFLYTDYSANSAQYGIYAADLETKSTKRVLPIYSSARYSRYGFLLFVKDSLMAQRFNLDALEVSGEPTAIAHFVRQRYDLGFKGDFSVSHTGVLAVRSAGANENRVVSIDRRTGRETAHIDALSWHSNPTLSHDGTRLAVTAGDGATSDHLWILDSGTLLGRQLTFERGLSYAPLWSPNADRLIYVGGTRGLLEQSLNGTPAAPVSWTPPSRLPESWSRDGRFMTFMKINRTTKGDVWGLRLDDPGTPFPILTGAEQEGQSQISPDGRYLAYASDASGRFEVYVATFPVPDKRWQVSSGGGTDPRWRGDGGELYYIAADRQMMASRTTLRPSFSSGPGVALFETHLDDVWIGDTRNHYDVTPDGRRFIVLAPKTDRRLAPFSVLVNWQHPPARAGMP
jgi:Tol biopolymer transport system component